MLYVRGKAILLHSTTAHHMWSRGPGAGGRGRGTHECPNMALNAPSNTLKEIGQILVSHQHSKLTAIIVHSFCAPMLSTHTCMWRYHLCLQRLTHACSPALKAQRKHVPPSNDPSYVTVPLSVSTQWSNKSRHKLCVHFYYTRTQYVLSNTGMQL